MEVEEGSKDELTSVEGRWDTFSHVRDVDLRAFGGVGEDSKIWARREEGYEGEGGRERSASPLNLVRSAILRYRSYTSSDVLAT